MGIPETGNCRRESYQAVPMPRMTNTYMLAGDDAPEDILRSVKRGLYAVNFGGGQVDITNGKFVFSASEGLPHRRRQDHRARQGRDADRQRPRSAEVCLDGRPRSATR